MRPLKVRAWNNGKMLYPDGIFFNPVKPSHIRLYFGNPEPGVEYRSAPYNLNEPTIIMQFTGLHDKNGKEIYEGDILGCGGKKPYEYIHEVKLIVNDSNIRYDYGYSHEHNFPAPHWVEIIGNIHENPELLAHPTPKERR